MHEGVHADLHASAARGSSQERVEKAKTFELRNVIFDLDDATEMGKRDIKAP